ncbi:MAG: hypothetical protein J6J31_08180 [Thermoguttaceae bacterium]|nr:hypothetical protein [Thermoguttaceae bacterium]
MMGLRNFAVWIGFFGSVLGTPCVLSASETIPVPPEKRVSVDVALSAENEEGRASENMLSGGIGVDGRANAAPFSGAELQRNVRAALKRWKAVPDTQAEAAASEFLALYRAVEADSELPEKARNGMKRTLKDRLEALSRQILTHLVKERETNAKHSDPAERPENAERPKSVNRSRSVDRSGIENAAERDERDGEIAELGQIVGGAGGVGNGLGGIGDAGGDGASRRVQESGEHLVEVIQATIHPDSWESNGGQGTIYFWMPNGSLIIRQTDANHEEIRNLLNQLRRAGS